jgi:hypothetical protein
MLPVANAFGSLGVFFEFIIAGVKDLTPSGWMIIVSVIGTATWWVYRTYHKFYDKALDVRDKLIAGIEKSEVRIKAEKDELQTTIIQISKHVAILRAAVSPDAGRSVLILEEFVRKLLLFITLQMTVKNALNELSTCVLVRPPLCRMHSKDGLLVNKVLDIKKVFRDVEFQSIRIVLESVLFLQKIESERNAMPDLPSMIKQFSIVEPLKELRNAQAMIFELWGADDLRERFETFDLAYFDRIIAGFEEEQKAQERAGISFEDTGSRGQGICV